MKITTNAEYGQEKAAKSGRIPEILNDVDISIDQLSEAIERLVARLSPALVENPLLAPSIPAPSEVMPRMSEFALMLQNKQKRIDRWTVMLSAICDNLEL